MAEITIFTHRMLVLRGRNFCLLGSSDGWSGSGFGPFCQGTEVLKRLGLFFCISLFLMASANLAAAQSLTTTNFCRNNAPDEDLDLIEEAYLFVYDNTDVLWAEIDRDRAGSGIHNYSFVSPQHRANFEHDIQAIKVGCRYNAVSRSCRNSPGLMGRCPWFWSGAGPFIPELSSKVAVCMDNIAGMAFDPVLSTVGTTNFALLAGTLAHEVMHQGDGLEGHDEGTTPQSPETAAETIGVAIENLAITPDLNPRFSGVSTTYDGEVISVSLDVIVENDNAFSGTPGLAIALNGNRTQVIDRNVDSVLCILVDGVPDLFRCQVVQPLEASGAQTLSFSFELESYNFDSEYTLEAVADYGSVIFEYDESNNSATTTITTAADLEVLSINVANAPTWHVMEYVNDADLPGYYNWTELTYNVEVRNNSSQVTTPTFDVVFYYDDMFTDSSMMTQMSDWTEPLAPGESQVLQFTLPIETDVSGSVVGSTSLKVLADGNAENVVDPDRSNNLIEMEIDEDYFRPDYRVKFDDVEIDYDAGAIEASVTAVNLGPVAATGMSLAQLKINGVPVDSFFLGSLDVAASSTRTMSGPFTVIASAEYELEVTVDASDRINENDESNNSAALKWRFGIDLQDLQLTDELVLADDFRLHDRLVDSMVDWAHLGPFLEFDLHDWIGLGSPGPTFPEPHVYFFGLLEQALVVASYQNVPIQVEFLNGFNSFDSIDPVQVFGQLGFRDSPGSRGLDAGERLNAPVFDEASVTTRVPESRFSRGRNRARGPGRGRVLRGNSRELSTCLDGVDCSRSSFKP